MRILVANALINGPGTDPAVAGRVYEASALGVGDVPAQPPPPYITYIEDPGTVVRGVQDTSRAQHRNFRIQVHDHLGSFVQIERILDLVRETMLALESTVSPSGAVCMGVWWTGTSSDITDPTRGRNVKFSTFRVTTNK